MSPALWSLLRRAVGGGARGRLIQDCSVVTRRLELIQARGRPCGRLSQDASERSRRVLSALLQLGTILCERQLLLRVPRFIRINGLLQLGSGLLIRTRWWRTPATAVCAVGWRSAPLWWTTSSGTGTRGHMCRDITTPRDMLIQLCLRQTDTQTRPVQLRS